jgi:hypothetical protein
VANIAAEHLLENHELPGFDLLKKPPAPSRSTADGPVYLRKAEKAQW